MQKREQTLVIAIFPLEALERPNSCYNTPASLAHKELFAKFQYLKASHERYLTCFLVKRVSGVAALYNQL